MATEQAHEAAPAENEAAPIAGADNTDSLPSDKAALLAMMNAPQEESQESEEIEPEQEENPQEEDIEPEEEETPEPEEEPESEGEEEPHLSTKTRNVRINVSKITDPKERRVIELQKKGLSPTEAYRAVYGATPEAPAQAREAAANPLSEIDHEISQLNQESSQLDAKITEAQFDEEAQTALLKQRRELDRKIGKLEAKKESIASRQEADVEQSRQSETDKSFNRTLEEFPDAFTKDDGSGKYTFDRSTRLGRLAANRYKLAQGTPAASSPDFVAIVVAEAADIIGYEKSKPVQTVRQVQKQTVTRPPQRGARPVATGGIEPTNPDDPARFKQLLTSGSQKDLLAEMARQGLKI
jgi:hypothetical protein